MNYVASPHFKLNSQPVCFLGLPSKMTNWGSTFLLEPLRWAHWSPPPHAGDLGLECRAAKQPLFVFFFNRGVRCRGLPCVPVFVWVCVRGHRAPVSTDLPPPPNSASEWSYCSLDAVNFLSPFYLFLNIPGSGTPSGRHVTCHMATILIFYLHYDFKIHWKAITHFHGCTTV